MQPVKRKQPKQKKLPLGVTFVLGVILLGVLLAGIFEDHSAPSVTVAESTATYRTLFATDTENVVSIEVTHADGDCWRAEQKSEGILYDDRGFSVDATLSRALLSEAAVIACEEVVADSRQDYEANLDMYGLDEPRASVCITYRDGKVIWLWIGGPYTQSDVSYDYMTWSESEELFGISRASRNEWMISAAMLHPVPELMIHGARCDRIEISFNGRENVWALDGAVSDETASDNWRILSPVSYLCDGEAMRTLLSSLQSLRLGGYECEADAASLASYGFLSPQGRIAVHLSEGLGTQVNKEGVAEPLVYEESEVILSIGGSKNDFVDYVCYEGAIYRMSRIMLSPVLEKDAEETLLRYVTRIAGENIRELSVTENGEEVRHYVITEVTGMDGDTARQVFEGEREIPYATFLARYSVLEQATVAGRVEADFIPDADEQTVITLWDQWGSEFSITLCPMDRTFDAVRLMDSDWLFYIPRNLFAEL